ncbi:hypothetical protein ALT_4065 [Aspergillus lentulus]|uniref:Ribosomal protein S21 n=1 Tax=Aspergillus lentulus TaxID=293939 RepID=A0AAN4PHL2_ASPLE|nr:uncharacterized protein IFM58399_02244 [Aspergillus lentulus]KAF4160707.1 hypothetical protein CNMCM6069_007492 [Aspergillus lentulus]KAF4180526.1 hypothetical protein CNMCM8060_001219 [Aspergillus lentulus]KAF4185296.1 hypothetical protein CNMCM7927_006859 [Aspergillus lentulus]KAF4195829.1 hypothetical protein CNMCM8694_005843 [Aspergillus lentulus]KAF4210059.1 hypothetical protein CNMCM8927_003324 [Aspergillus lentulus]
MEARSLARCLRLRPTTSLYTTQPIIFRGQNALRYFSTSNSLLQTTPASQDQPTSTTPASTQEQSKVQTSSSSTATNSNSADFDRILNQLNFNNTNRNATEGGQSSDPLSLSRAVRMAPETDSYKHPLRRVELKLGPTLGRQVHVEPEKGVDLTTALRVLQGNITTNKVRAQWHAQKFHVRRGQMRKNLRMDRWRKLFKFSFKETVNKIQRMRAQGW